MIEAFESLHHFDAHVGQRIGEHAAQRVERAVVTNAAKRLDGRPFQVGIAERGDERLDSARIFQFAECVGGGDSNPPVRIAQQIDRRWHDARVVEAGRHGNSGAANFLVGIAEKFDHRLDQIVAECAESVQRALIQQQHGVCGTPRVWAWLV